MSEGVPIREWQQKRTPDSGPFPGRSFFERWFPGRSFFERSFPGPSFSGRP